MLKYLAAKSKWATRFLSLGLLTALLVACGGSGEAEPTVDPPPPPPPATPVATTVRITPNTVQFDSLEETRQLSAEVLDQNSQVMTNTSVQWSSGSVDIVTVSTSGLATAVTNGSTEVTATSGNASATASVSVKQVADSVSVSIESLSFHSLGDSEQVTAEVFDARGNLIQDEPMSWESDSSIVASVDQQGLVTANDNGSATVLVRSGAAKHSIPVVVNQVVASIKASPATIDFDSLGSTATISVDLFDGNGNSIEEGSPSWESADSEIATVDEQGTVTAIGDGVTSITVTVGSFSARVVISVVVEPASAIPGSVDGDRKALEVFYEATNGLEWIDSSNWLSDKPLSEWHGVYTHSRTGRVTTLYLASNGLSGSLPKELGELAALEFIHLGSNQLTGAIPKEIGNLSLITELQLYLNKLSGSIPTEISGLPLLKVLDLSHNELSGTIPGELLQLENLESLQINYNNLSGNIPPEIGNVTRLRRLALGSNQLSGSLPSALGSLKELRNLQLFLNEFDGGIPPELGNLSKLNWLDLVDSGVTGVIPDSLINLKLDYFGWAGNPGLCIPGTQPFYEWTSSIGNHVSGDTCSGEDQRVLEALYASTAGVSWSNSEGWLEGTIDSWYGVETNERGHVIGIDLANNGLVGELRGNLGDLRFLTVLRLDNNPGLTGRIPYTLERLKTLVEFSYRSTSLCIPQEGSIRTWLNGLDSHQGTGIECEPNADRDVLDSIFTSMGGDSWFQSKNWLSNEPLRSWYGVETDVQGRVTSLDLTHNNLAGKLSPELVGLESLQVLKATGNSLSDGPLPPELGGLKHLRVLELSGIEVSGSIPTEYGNLESLQEFHLSENKISGAIPASLWGLSNLRHLNFASNNLSGAIPDGISQLNNLTEIHLEDNAITGPVPRQLFSMPSLRLIDLSGNQLSGSLPSEFSDQTELAYLNLSRNQLSGDVPKQFGELQSLRELYLANNRLTGPIPEEIGSLSELNSLAFSGNTNMSGVISESLRNLGELQLFYASRTQLCANPNSALSKWLDTLLVRRVLPCNYTKPNAYLIQSVQSRDIPVTLVAGKPALLRVFPLANATNSENLPAISVDFYVNGQLIHTVDESSSAGPIPTQIYEGSLSQSINVVIPASVIQPNLEMVVEIDPNRQIATGLGVAGRIPETGRLSIDVRKMPDLEITFIPFLWDPNPDRSVINLVDEMVADPNRHPMLAPTRTLLPIQSITASAHDPVRTSTNEASDLIGQVHAIEAIEGGNGYYMGLLAGEFTGASGIANVGHRTSYSVTNASVIAHELGHNLSLNHTPCGSPLGIDPAYPYKEAALGAWGYDFGDGGGLVNPSDYYDLMSYCGPYWISDFSFDKALRYRLHTSGLLNQVVASRPVASLLIWGGVDGQKRPFLEPAVVVNSQPSLPKSVGRHMVEGYDDEGIALFRLRFEMPVVEDGDGTARFAYTVPIDREWKHKLRTITFYAPKGSFTINEATNMPVTIIQNRSSGRVTGFIRGEVDRLGSFSRGLPDLSILPN